jgi:hypothetical protein
LILCSGVAFSSSEEESERMYSGTSSVPKIASGAGQDWKKQRGVNREIANESKKQINRKLALEWYASLVEYCPP